MARMLKWLSYAALSFALTGSLVGCVPQEKYNAKVLENSALAEQANSAQQEAASAKSQNEAYKNQVQTLSDQETTAQAMAENLRKENAAQAEELASYKAKLADLINQPPNITVNAGYNGTGNALPQPLTSALTDFAAKYPDLVEFNPATGVVKFKSDVTFATGSHNLTPEAKTVIDKFASILNSPAAEEYELNVAGHTDNVPVTNKTTIANGDLNNVYLSAHRAISVYDELASQGVHTSRMAVVGYGDQRPIADNGTSAGRRANRRVEVLILPTRRGSAMTASSSSTPRKQTSAPKRDLNKDSAAAPVEPVLNK
jgi:chemotaxis protein MotB